MERLKKIARGFLGGLIGFIFMPWLILFTPSSETRFIHTVFMGVTYILMPVTSNMNRSIMFTHGLIIAGSLYAAAITILGIYYAIRCAYSTYHLGIRDGIKAVLAPNERNAPHPAPAGERLLQQQEVKAEERHQQAAMVKEKIAQAMQKPAPTFQPLRDDEIKQYNASSSTEEKQQLQKYQSYINDECAISRSPLKELQNDAMITIERKEIREGLPDLVSTFTYEKDEFNTWIRIKNVDLTNPIDNTSLNNPNIDFYLGLPKWIIQFVTSVREKLASVLSPKVKQDTTQDLSKEQLRAQRIKFFGKTLLPRDQPELSFDHSPRYHP